MHDPGSAKDKNSIYEDDLLEHDQNRNRQYVLKGSALRNTGNVLYNIPIIIILHFSLEISIHKTIWGSLLYKLQQSVSVLRETAKNRDMRTKSGSLGLVDWQNRALYVKSLRYPIQNQTNT